MKTRTTPATERAAALADTLATVSDPGDMARLLDDLCTPAELEALADRLLVAQKLVQGDSYRTISAATSVSLATVTRVARALSGDTGGYRRALELGNCDCGVTRDELLAPRPRDPEEGSST